MCILDLIKLHVSQNHRAKEAFKKYSMSLADLSKMNYSQRLRMKHSYMYPEFMLLKSDSETLSACTQGSLCTDFVFCEGDSEILHEHIDHEK